MPFVHEPLVPQVSDTSRAGELVKLEGQRGTFKVLAHVLTEAGGEWIELFDTTRKQFRFVRPDRVRWSKPPREKRGSK